MNKKKRIVIALGGNALGNTLPEQMAAVKVTSKAIVDLIEEGCEVVVTHGNGPQVGMINNAMIALTHEDAQQPNTPLSVCVAMSQAYIGYDLQNALREELFNRGITDIPVATMITQVRVNEDDPAFNNPSKPIGKFFNEDQTGLGCLDDGTAKEAFSFMKDLQDSGALYYNDPANDQDNQMFTSGMAAMTINSSGAITSRRETIGDSFEYVVAPLVKGKIESMPTGGNGFGILAASKEQDAAWKFMKWFIEDEKGGLAFVIGSGYLPFTKTMAQSDAIQQLWKESDNYKIAYDALQYGDDSYRIANLTPVIAEFRTCIQAIMLDNQDIDQSLKTFSDSVDIILND